MNESGIFYFLYTLGSELLSFNFLDELLAFDVMGVTFSYIISVGFLGYAGWVITKWVVGIIP